MSNRFGVAKIPDTSPRNVVTEEPAIASASLPRRSFLAGLGLLVALGGDRNLSAAPSYPLPQATTRFSLQTIRLPKNGSPLESCFTDRCSQDLLTHFPEVNPESRVRLVEKEGEFRRREFNPVTYAHELGHLMHIAVKQCYGGNKRFMRNQFLHDPVTGGKMIFNCSKPIYFENGSAAFVPLPPNFSLPELRDRIPNSLRKSEIFKLYVEKAIADPSLRMNNLGELLDELACRIIGAKVALTYSGEVARFSEEKKIGRFYEPGLQPLSSLALIMAVTAFTATDKKNAFFIAGDAHQFYAAVLRLVNEAILLEVRLHGDATVKKFLAPVGEESWSILLHSKDCESIVQGIKKLYGNRIVSDMALVPSHPTFPSETLEEVDSHELAEEMFVLTENPYHNRQVDLK